MLMHRDNAGMHGEGIFIGTSGWSYGHWKGPFYPAALPAGGFLPFYAGRFCTVEINSSFYRLPEERTLSRWRDSVPDSFVFAVKGSGFITHRKKLRDPHATLPPFFERIAALGDQALPRGVHGRLRLRPAPRAGGPLPGALRRRDARPVGREVPRLGRAGEAGPLLFRQRPGGIRGPQRPSAPGDAAPGLTARSRRPSEGRGSGYRTLIVRYFAIRTSPGFAPLNLGTGRGAAKNTRTFGDPS